MNPEPDFRDVEHTKVLFKLVRALCAQYLDNMAPTVCGTNFLFNLPFVSEVPLVLLLFEICVTRNVFMSS